MDHFRELGLFFVVGHIGCHLAGNEALMKFGVCSVTYTSAELGIVSREMKHAPDLVAEAFEIARRSSC